jgi:cold shock CspA family protein
MRDQGRLVEWFDEKGYGFIQPNDDSKDRVFLHIKDFARQGPRPILGCALEYNVLVDAQGRYRAQQVSYLKASQTQKSRTQKVSSKKDRTTTLESNANCVGGIHRVFGTIGIAGAFEWISAAVD